MKSPMFDFVESINLGAQTSLIASFITSVVLCLTNVFYITCPQPTDTKIDVSSVSGFYGPGAISAWLILSITTLLTGEWSHLRSLLVKVMPRTTTTTISSTTNDERIHTSSHVTSMFRRDVGILLNANVLSVAAYHFVACGDILLRYWTRSEASPQLHAALAVSNMGAGIAYVAMWPGKDRRWFSTEPRTAREVLWHVVIFTNTAALIYGDDKRHVGSAVILILDVVVAIVMQMNLAALVCTRLSIFDFLLRWFAPTRFVVLFFLKVAVVEQKELPLLQWQVCQYRWEVAWPRSAASIGDLDQAATLAVALGMALYPLMGKLRKWIRGYHAISQQEIQLEAV